MASWDVYYAAAMNILHRSIGWLFLIQLLFTLNGCMTHSAVDRATGTSSRSYPSGAGGEIHYQMHAQPHPAYYALLPLTVPADIVTSPFQLGYYVWHRHEQKPDPEHNSR